MSLMEFKILWTSWVAGPEVLFALRIGTLVPLFIFGCLKMWEVFSPLHRHPLLPVHDKWIWRVLVFLISIFAFAGVSYYLCAGLIERDRGGTPFRLVYLDGVTAALYWCLCLSAMKSRKESWERKFIFDNLPPLKEL